MYIISQIIFAQSVSKESSFQKKVVLRIAVSAATAAAAGH
jgi:hypothetical protein